MPLTRWITLLSATVLLASVSTAIAQGTTGATVIAEAYRSTNIRSGPNTSYDVIDHLNTGETVDVIGRSDAQSNWLLIDRNGQRGWVAFFTVTVHGETNNLPIVQPETPGVATPALASSEGLIEAPRAETDLYVTAYRRVNVRSGPGTEFNILGVLVPGETADIVGSSGDDHEWLEIAFEGESGWVAFFVVNVVGNVEALETNVPIITSLPEQDEAQPEANPTLDTNQVIVITRFNTNLRAEPRQQADILAVIPFDTTLRADARTADERWLRVDYEDQRGWLIASLVNTGVSDVESLPVVADALLATAEPRP